MALNWLINYHGDVIVAIPGATSVNYALENTGAMKFMLSGEDMEMLDSASAKFI